MEVLNLLSDQAPRGSVLYADDCFLSQQIMRKNFADMGIGDSLVTFNDGQLVIDYFRRYLNAEVGEG